jgi:branched-chain amino acid transport system permease protein
MKLIKLQKYRGLLLFIATLLVFAYMRMLSWWAFAVLALTSLFLSLIVELKKRGKFASPIRFSKRFIERARFGKRLSTQKTRVYLFGAGAFFFIASLLPFNVILSENTVYHFFILLYSLFLFSSILLYLSALISRRTFRTLLLTHLGFVSFGFVYVLFSILQGVDQLNLAFILWTLSGISCYLIFSASQGGIEKEKVQDKAPSKLCMQLLLLSYMLLAVIVLYYIVYVDGLYMFVNVALFAYALIKLFAGWHVKALLRDYTKKTLLLIFAPVLLLSVAILLFQSNSKVVALLFSIVTLSVVASGLNLVVGFTGLLDLGYIAFFGMGAYVAAIFSNTNSGSFHFALPILLVLPMAAICSGIFGGLVGAPTLMVKGDFLAIITLGFGEVFRIVVNNLDNVNGHNLTNGPNGIAGIPPLQLFHHGLDSSIHTALGEVDGDHILLIFLVVLLSLLLLLIRNLKSSLYGGALFAIKKNETVATSLGVNTFLSKLMVFVAGASFAGFFGGIYAHIIKVISPDQFQFTDSVNLLIAVILGGGGTIMGAVLGVFIMVLLPEKLRFLQDYRLLIFAVLLIIMIKLLPNGILGRNKAR